MRNSRQKLPVRAPVCRAKSTWQPLGSALRPGASVRSGTWSWVELRGWAPQVRVISRWVVVGGSQLCQAAKRQPQTTAATIISCAMSVQPEHSTGHPVCPCLRSRGRGGAHACGSAQGHGKSLLPVGSNGRGLTFLWSLCWWCQAGRSWWGMSGVSCGCPLRRVRQSPELCVCHITEVLGDWWSGGVRTPLQGQAPATASSTP